MKRHYSGKFEFNTRSVSYRTMPVAMISGSGSNDGGSGDGSLGEHSIDPVEIWGSGGNDNQGDLGDQMSYLDSILGSNGNDNGLIGASIDGSGSANPDSDGNDNYYEYGNMICEMTPSQFAQVKPLLDKLPDFLKFLKVRVKIGRTQGNASAQYISSTNTVVLNEQFVNVGNYDDLDSVLEEFFHAIQDIWFTENGIDMGKQSISAVEFEAKVMKWLYEAASLEGVKEYNELSDIVDWIYKCLGNAASANSYDWSNFNSKTFYNEYRKYYDLFVEYYKSIGDDDIGHYSDGEYMFWKDHWDYFFDQMRIIFNGKNDFGSAIIITAGSGNDETSYPDAGSY